MAGRGRGDDGGKSKDCDGTVEVREETEVELVERVGEGGAVVGKERTADESS